MEELNLWFEKYRPQNLDDCILTTKMKDIFRGYIDKKEVPNLMLTGLQGTGKTTLAKVIVKELGAEMLFIDCSTESGKQMVQEQVVPFASTISMGNNDVPKFILCDECIEEHETVRIGTINSWKDVPINQLEIDNEYPVVSFNMETQTLENDTAILVTDKEDDLYEITFFGNNKLVCNEHHPFVIKDESGNIVIKKLKDFKPKDRCFFVADIDDGACHKLLSYILSVKKLDKKGRVMDIQVAKNHTFITSNGLVTHNCDGLLPAAQKSLRPIIERFAITTRFIFTANYAEKIIPALKSRCACFDFAMNKKEQPQLMKAIYNRCKYILDDNNISYDKKPLMLFIGKWYPDFRRIINELQSYATGYGEINEGILSAGTNNDIADQLYPLILAKDFKKCKEWLVNSVDSPEDIFAGLYNKMNDYIKPELQPTFIIILAQYQEYSSHVMNQNINTLALLTELIAAV